MSQFSMPEFGSGDGFTGFATVDKLLNGYLNFEVAQTQLDFAKAANQQQRLQNTVEVNEQINDQARSHQAQVVGGVNWQSPVALIGVAVAGGIALKLAKVI